MRLLTNKKQRGFTIVEMLVAIVVLGLLLAVGAPSFTSIFQINNIAEASNRFVSSMTYARNTAISSNLFIVMCRANENADNCENNNNGQWEDGWIIWADLDNDNVLDGNENILLSERGLPQGFTLRATNNSFVNRIDYSPTGDATGDVANNAEIFRLCDPDGIEDDARLIYLNAVGRAWVNRTSGFDSGITGVPDCP